MGLHLTGRVKVLLMHALRIHISAFNAHENVT